MSTNRFHPSFASPAVLSEIQQRAPWFLDVVARYQACAAHALMDLPVTAAIRQLQATESSVQLAAARAVRVLVRAIASEGESSDWQVARRRLLSDAAARAAGLDLDHLDDPSS